MPQHQLLITGRTSSPPEQWALQVVGVERYTPYPAPIYPHTWRGRYPHLMPADVAIWNRFLDKHGKLFKGFQYDVCVGKGADAPLTMQHFNRKLLYALTVKRIDALGIQPQGVTLFEIKPRLGMACLGQCIAYRELWQMHYANAVPVVCCAVVEHGEPDLQYCLQRLQIQLAIV